MRHCTVSVLLALTAVLLAACGNDNGLPTKDGQYPIQSHSVTWDGDQYRFYWADSNGGLHQAHGKDFKLIQDDRSFLQVQDHHGMVHLPATEPISVLAQDHNGNFSNSWFPFLAGAALGSILSGPRVPTYYYPPTDTFGRGDELHGAVTNPTPKPPDYSTIKPPPDAVRPAAGSVAGQSSGTGGGNAATNKLGGASGSQSDAVAGQSGGTGAGSAVNDKGGFRSGSSSYSAKTSGSSAGSSRGKGISGAGSGHSSAPSRSSGGASRSHR